MEGSVMYLNVKHFLLLLTKEILLHKKHLKFITNEWNGDSDNNGFRGCRIMRH